MTKTHSTRDDRDRRSSDAQPHGLAASVIENVRHGLEKIRARAFEHDDARHDDDNHKENAMRNVRNLAVRRYRDDENAIAARKRETAAVEVRDEPSGVVRLGLELDLKLKSRQSENDQNDLGAPDEVDSDETELGIQDDASDPDEGIDDASTEDEDLQNRQRSDTDEEHDEDDSLEDSHIQDDEDEDESSGHEREELAARRAQDHDELEARAEADELAFDDEDEGEQLEAANVDEDEDLGAHSEDDEDEDFRAHSEDDEDEDLGARSEDDEDEDFEARSEDDEDEDFEARSEDDEDDELEARSEDDDELEARSEAEEDGEADDDTDEHPELRSAGDGGSLAATARARDADAGSARPALGIARPQKPKPQPQPATTSQADRIIRIAKHQVGFREGKNNHTKFAAELIKRKIAQPWWQNQPWCETFLAWAFVEAGYRKLAPMTPGCATAIAWFRARKRVNKYPAIGAQVFFGRGGSEHVGLVYKYDPTHVWTIEGNTNDDGSSEGIGVFLKKRARKSAFGYGYPKYAEGIVTADPRKKGKPGFTFKKSASSGARDAASEPDREEKTLPWVSVRQVQWAAKHSPAAERAAKAGAANPRADVKLVQQALAKVLGIRSKDPAGIFEEDTQRLFHRFRTRKLKFAGIRPSAAPGAKGLTALGRLSKLFRVRTGSMPQVDDHAGSTTPAKLSPRDVTFKRCTTPSTPDNISKWIRQACKKSGVMPSSAWVKGYKTIIKRESGGNPNACNVWDSNAKTPPGFHKVKDYGDGYMRSGIVRLNGRPTHFQCSRGIVQCIPQTFAAHHARGTSRSIYDPVASIAASIRYVRGRYDVAKDGSNLARKVQQADPTRPPKGY
jgi:Transglycosylase SLT domain